MDGIIRTVCVACEYFHDIPATRRNREDISCEMDSDNFMSEDGCYQFRDENDDRVSVLLDQETITRIRKALDDVR